MLTPFGLLLNFVGSIILLGTDIDIIKTAIKKSDPIHRLYMRKLRKIEKKASSKELINENSAYPYNKTVKVDGLDWWAMSRFLSRHVEQQIPREAQVDIQGGWFKIDGEQLTFSDSRRVKFEDGSRLDTGTIASLSAVYGLLYEGFLRRIYIYGVFFLALGFLLQLVNSLL